MKTLHPIADIKIGQRHRRDLGDVAALAQSIEQLGLLHPVVIRPDAKLIAGARRIAACKSLGWKRIPVRVLDLNDVVRGELAENACRKNFTPSEIVAIGEAVEIIEREQARKRQGRRNDLVANCHHVDGGKTRDRVAALFGVGGKTYEKMKRVVAAARKNPKRFSKLVAAMDRGSRIHPIYNRLLRYEDESRVKNLRPIAGKYATLIIDPPWQSGGGPDGTPYTTMTQDELLNLPIPKWSAPNSHIYLWATNSEIFNAKALLDHYGFTFKEILVWNKLYKSGTVRQSMGYNFRHTTEYVLFGVRGKMRTREAARNINTGFEASVSRHSTKPEVFYDLVRAASYGPYGEAFQRKPRPDFDNLYEPIVRLEAAE
jgi:ParB/RepB/Spo0J family partition protein